MATDTDLYGFPVKLNELQKAEREACDAASVIQQPVWMEYIEKDRLPSRCVLFHPPWGLLHHRAGCWHIRSQQTEQGRTERLIDEALKH